MTMQQKINVVFIGNQITFGGGATSFYLLIKSLNKSFVEKYVFASTISSQEMQKHFQKHCLRVEKINIHEVKSSQTSLTSLRNYIHAKINSRKDAKYILSLIEQSGADILHFNNSVFSHLYKYIKDNCDVKIITHVREMIMSNESSYVAKSIVKNINTYSDCIITISDNEAQPFNDHNNLQILANPFDFTNTLIKRSNFRKQNNIDENVVLVGMMGRFARSKGHLLFLQTLKELRTKNINHQYMFVLIGIAESSRSIKKTVKNKILRHDLSKEINRYIISNNLSKTILLVPYSNDIFRIIQAMDIIIRPSLHRDPWGRDIIESMALGKPIVATGDSEFFIQNNINGYLVKNNPKAISNKIVKLINNKKLRIEIGKRNSLKIKKLCDIKNYGFNVEKIYKSLV